MYRLNFDDVSGTPLVGSGTYTSTGATVVEGYNGNALKITSANVNNGIHCNYQLMTSGSYTMRFLLKTASLQNVGFLLDSRDGIKADTTLFGMNDDRLYLNLKLFTGTNSELDTYKIYGIEQAFKPNEYNEYIIAYDDAVKKLTFYLNGTPFLPKSNEVINKNYYFGSRFTLLNRQLNSLSYITKQTTLGEIDDFSVHDEVLTPKDYLPKVNCKTNTEGIITAQLESTDFYNPSKVNIYLNNSIDPIISKDFVLDEEYDIRDGFISGYNYIKLEILDHHNKVLASSIIKYYNITIDTPQDKLDENSNLLEIIDRVRHLFYCIEERKKILGHILVSKNIIDENEINSLSLLEMINSVNELDVLKKRYLYKEGDLCSNITGGWVMVKNPSCVVTTSTNPELYIKNTTAGGSGSEWIGYFYTNNLIDLSGYKTINFEVTSFYGGTYTAGSCNYDLRVSANKIYNGGNNDALIRIGDTAVKIVSLNIENITSGYVGFRAYCFGSYISIKNIWLE